MACQVLPKFFLPADNSSRRRETIPSFRVLLQNRDIRVIPEHQAVNVGTAKCGSKIERRALRPEDSLIRHGLVTLPTHGTVMPEPSCVETATCWYLNGRNNGSSKACCYSSPSFTSTPQRNSRVVGPDDDESRSRQTSTLPVLEVCPW